jgi:GntR family transcriptional regulator/MocR family aminotransferase
MVPISFDLHIRLDSGRPLARELYEQLRDAIAAGRLADCDRLPATRTLAERLSVSRNTVVWAYELLAAEGYVESRVGSGFSVCAGARSPRAAPPVPVAQLSPRPVWNALQVPARPARLPYDLTIGAPDAGLFPLRAWHRLHTAELRAMVQGLADYRDPAGEWQLRDAIARHASLSRSIRCAARDIMIVGGAQQAFDLVGRCLLEPGDIVAMEAPGYSLARLTFEALGAQVALVRIDAEGLVVDELPTRARLVFVTPSHQFPTGVPMSLPRRHALLRWAAASGAAVVEDDYNGELRFDGRPLEPLHRLDDEGRVIFVSSLSKVLHPGLRLGYLVAPPSLRSALRTARLLTDWHSPLDQQRALAGFISSGRFAAHLRALHGVYGARRRRLREALARRLPEMMVLKGVAGLHFGVALDGGRVDSRTVATTAATHGVGISPWSDFGLGPGSADGFSLGFGTIQEEAIEPAIDRLAKALRPSFQATGRRARPRPPAP